LSSNTFVAMSHPFVDFEHRPQVLSHVTLAEHLVGIVVVQ
jgi:hypothetical protein